MLMVCLMALGDEEDRACFSRFYAHYERKLYAVALKILHDRRAAEDVVSQAFLKMAEDFEKNKKYFQNFCQETDRWCVIVVKNFSISYLRREKRFAELDPWWDPPAAETAESADGYRRLVALIRALPERYRTVLELRFVCEWSSREIARHLGLGVNAVDARISRGRKLLLEQLRKEGYCDAQAGEPIL